MQEKELNLKEIPNVYKKITLKNMILIKIISFAGEKSRAVYTFINTNDGFFN